MKFEWLQKPKLFRTDLTNLDLNRSDVFPIKCSTHINFFLGARVYTFLYMKILFKNLLIQTSIKLQGQSFFKIMSLRLNIS